MMDMADRSDAPSTAVEEGSKGSFATTTAVSTRLDTRDSLPLLGVSPSNHGGSSSPWRRFRGSSEESSSPIERSRRHSLQWQGSGSSWQSIMEESGDAGPSLVSEENSQVEVSASTPDDKSHLCSPGSELHGTGACRPCAWFHKPVGCQNGSECRHCHLCPEGEVKARRRIKSIQLRGRPMQGGAVQPGRILRVAEDEVYSSDNNANHASTSSSSSNKNHLSKSTSTNTNTNLNNNDVNGARMDNAREKELDRDEEEHRDDEKNQGENTLSKQRKKAAPQLPRAKRGIDIVNAVLPTLFSRTSVKQQSSRNNNSNTASNSRGTPISEEEARQLQGANSADSEPSSSFSRDDYAAFCAPPGLQINSSKAPNESIGALLHGSGLCRPCAWYYKSSGCANGEQCRHCHMCPEGEIKARRKAKLGSKSASATPVASTAMHGNYDQEDPCGAITSLQQQQQQQQQQGAQLPQPNAPRKVGFHLPFFSADHLTASAADTGVACGSASTGPAATLLQHRSGCMDTDLFAQQACAPKVGSVASGTSSMAGTAWSQHELENYLWISQQRQQQQHPEEVAMLSSLSASSLWDTSLHETAAPSAALLASANNVTASATGTATASAAHCDRTRLTGSLMPSAQYDFEARSRGLALNVSGGVIDVSGEARLHRGSPRLQV